MLNKFFWKHTNIDQRWTNSWERSNQESSSMEKIKQNQEIDVRYLQSFEKGHQYNQNTNSKRFSENFQRYVFVLSPPKSLSNVKIHQSPWSKWHIVKCVGHNLKNNTVCHPSRPLLKHTLPHSKKDFFELLQLTLNLIFFVHSFGSWVSLSCGCSFFLPAL